MATATDGIRVVTFHPQTLASVAMYPMTDGSKYQQESTQTELTGDEGWVVSLYFTMGGHESHLFFDAMDEAAVEFDKLSPLVDDFQHPLWKPRVTVNG